MRKKPHSSLRTKMDWMSVALTFFAVTLAIGVFLYFRPRYIKEGFSTVAVDKNMPRCFTRDTEAQLLTASLNNVVSSYTRSAFDEFKLILEKILCIEADISGPGIGINNTLNVAFATSHDIEPASSLVGRCLRGGIRNNEIELAMSKFETRGNELIDMLCADKYSKQKAFDMFHNILARHFQIIKQKCAIPRAAMDVPAGPRDPGYNIPYKLITYSEFIPSGGNQYI